MKKRVVALLGGLLVIGVIAGTWVLPGTAVSQEDRSRKSPFGFEKVEVPVEGLQATKAKWFNTAIAALESEYVLLTFGHTEVQEVMVAADSVLRAGLSLSASNSDRVALIERFIDGLAKLETMTESRLSVGATEGGRAAPAVYALRARRLEAQVQMVELQTKDK